MVRISLFFCIFFAFNDVIGQTNINKTTFNSSFIVQFNRVKPNTEEFKTAEMKVIATEGSDVIKLLFTVPNYWLRYKTTVADYVILETAIETVKLQNEEENAVAEGSINLNYLLSQNYLFTFSLPKDVFSKYLKDNLVKLTFCFAPNKDFIKNNLASEKFMDKAMIKIIGRVASKTIKYKVSQPDKAQYEKLIEWLAQPHQYKI